MRCECVLAILILTMRADWDIIGGDENDHDAVRAFDMSRKSSISVVTFCTSGLVFIIVLWLAFSTVYHCCLVEWPSRSRARRYHDLLRKYSNQSRGYGDEMVKISADFAMAWYAVAQLMIYLRLHMLAMAVMASRGDLMRIMTFLAAIFLCILTLYTALRAPYWPGIVFAGME